MKKLLFFSMLICISTLMSCVEDAPFQGEVEGFKPVYINKSTLRDIYSSTPKVIENPGKIYIKGAYVYINEKGKGIHVVNNSNPSNPQKIAFINVPANVDIAMKGNIMYVDNGRDLVSLDVSDIHNVKVKKRIENIYPAKTQLYPEFAFGYFECVDTTKGYVIDWVRTTLKDPKCFR